LDLAPKENDSVHMSCQSARAGTGREVTPTASATSVINETRHPLPAHAAFARGSRRYESGNANARSRLSRCSSLPPRCKEEPCRRARFDRTRLFSSARRSFRASVWLQRVSNTTNRSACLDCTF